MQRLLLLLETDEFEPDISIAPNQGDTSGKPSPSPSGKPSPSPSGDKNIVDKETLNKMAAKIDWTSLKFGALSPRMHKYNNPGVCTEKLRQAIHRFSYFMLSVQPNDRAAPGPMAKSMQQVIQNSPDLNSLDIKVLKTCFNYLIVEGEPGIRDRFDLDDNGVVQPSLDVYQIQGRFHVVNTANSFFYFFKSLMYVIRNLILPYSPSLQDALADALNKLQGFGILDDTDD